MVISTACLKRILILGVRSMLINPLHLASTPAAILNSLGLKLRLGFSTDDPTGHRHQNLNYHALVSLYDLDGRLLKRINLGLLRENSRMYFDVESILPDSLKGRDVLVCAHRIPEEVFDRYGLVDEEREMEYIQESFSMYRTVVEYSMQSGANGSVIYETPPAFNSSVRKNPSTSNLTFTPTSGLQCGGQLICGFD